MSRRVYLTSERRRRGPYLQHRLSENRSSLAGHGIHYPRRHGVLVRRLLVHENLALREGWRPPCPPDLHPWALGLAES